MGGELIERDVVIRTPDGEAEAWLFHPAGPPRPGVLLLSDIFGLRPAFRAMAARLAAQGYAVLLPNVFHRSGRPPLFDFEPEVGEERTMRRFGELAGPLTPAAMESDAAACLEALAAETSVAPGPVGVVGHCITGAMALRAAAACPERVAAAASFHGGGLFREDAASPHLLLPRIRARLLFGHAEEDRGMPVEAIAGLEEALRAWGGAFESETYAGARHGWTVPDRPVHHPVQAERAFERLLALLGECLQPRTGI
jgi:carboxymethylenebutenolidase